MVSSMLFRYILENREGTAVFIDILLSTNDPQN